MRIEKPLFCSFLLLCLSVISNSKCIFRLRILFYNFTKPFYIQHPYFCFTENPYISLRVSLTNLFLGWLTLFASLTLKILLRYSCFNILSPPLSLEAAHSLHVQIPPIVPLISLVFAENLPFSIVSRRQQNKKCGCLDG